MSEFKKIETQEELDALIGDRIARAEKSAREQAIKETSAKYADYDEIKKQNTQFTETIAKLNEDAKSSAAKADEDKKTIDDLNSKIKGYETDSVKTRITLELGLPYGLASRLSGTTEDEIRKDAESLIKMFGKKAAPASSREPDSYADNSRKESLKELAKGLHRDK